jgi:hypothetical protein
MKRMQSTPPLHDLFSVSGLVDVAVAFTVAEYLFLARRRRWRPKAMIDLLFALAPGVCLMLALRIALSGAGPFWIVALLSASLPLHLADSARRQS